MPRKTRAPRGGGRFTSGASMRPRPDAAENAVSPTPHRLPPARFNEAAARCRGKQGRWTAAPGPYIASMRPRPDAAENKYPTSHPNLDYLSASMRPRPDAAENRTRTSSRSRRRPARFNEAAARCRGKRTSWSQSRNTRPGFNEAAARCRGKRPQGCELGVRANDASMRPRPDAAENTETLMMIGFVPSLASMRPRPDAAENADGRLEIDDTIVASMRPRPDAAENLRDGRLHGSPPIPASMRPRPDAAENGPCSSLPPR